jgi:hypothetical protein
MIGVSEFFQYQTRLPQPGETILGFKKIFVKSSKMNKSKCSEWEKSKKLASIKNRGSRNLLRVNKVIGKSALAS